MTPSRHLTRVVPAVLRPPTASLSLARALAGRTLGVCAGPRSLAAPRAVWTPRIVSRGYSVKEHGAPARVWSFDEVKGVVEDARAGVVLVGAFLSSTPFRIAVGLLSGTLVDNRDVDVREPDELRQTGRIPGAVHIPMSAGDVYDAPEEVFRGRYGCEKPPLGSHLVFYCKAGVRAMRVAGWAGQAGWKKVGAYVGSWDEWEKRGGPVDRG
ncbi:hypothetical protein E4U42_004234 [Claviceps africana]|uniref:Rhodanese domain-containing protein n=1 Tax=Claviceps africana TaxID=83212 RepID=A0A8K0J5L7_9HYPO|nr:hypothetical protein E4U42_004234 [Claviceps africana]